MRFPTERAHDVWLKLENLQPMGSFKIRGAANAMALAGPEALRGGVYTASAGNMAQGVAWCARELGVPCTVIVPEHASDIKTSAIQRLGGSVVRMPFDEWWQVLVSHGHPDYAGLFIHPFADTAVMAGNGTIALEILEDLPDVNVVLCPFGGGGLACGIAAAMRELSPRTRVYAVEVETAAPLTASLKAGSPARVELTRTWIDGMGSTTVSGEMWPLARSLLAGTIVVTLAAVAEGVRALALRSKVVAEGAGGAAFAGAFDVQPEGSRVVSVVSGGNLESRVLAELLGAKPAPHLGWVGVPE